MKLIAKTFQGLEEVLAKELTELGANDIQIGIRMVEFTGDKEMLYRANFCLRTAVRVLMPIKEFKANDADEVYETAKSMPWDQYMDDSTTFLIDSVVFSDSFRHSKFVAYRVKDAIADYWREKTGKRPNVSISNPDLRINVHIAENKVTISLDSSGESLHKRGYRTGTVAAPINEVLAAGMILLTGWDGTCDFIDPFCGSGTILIEAALIAQNIYPGVFREEFGFERWRDFDEQLLEKIYNDDSNEREFDHKIYGFDINRQAVAIAQDNVRSAGVQKIVEVQQQDFYEFEWASLYKSKHTDSEEDGEPEALSPKDFGAQQAAPVRPAIIVTNPPYGERLVSDDLLELYATIGQRLKQEFAGNDAWIFSYRMECFDQIGFRPSTKYALYNGALPCEFRKYQVFAGKLKERRSEGLDIKSATERARNLHYKPLRHREEDEDGFDKKGSRDDEHYFRSRPDRNDHRSQRRPLFEGDDEPELNRHNFKWGDRDSSYRKDEPRHGRRDDRDRRSKDRPHGRNDRFGRNDRPAGRDNRDRKGGGRPNRQWGFDSEGRPFRRDE